MKYKLRLYHSKLILACLIVSSIVIGCASTIGKDFAIDTLISFNIDQATKLDVRTKLREPDSIKTVAGKEIWTYNFAKALLHLNGDEFITGKNATISFLGDKLVDYICGYESINSMPNSAVIFDVEKIGNLEKGTSANEIEKKFGTPTLCSYHNGQVVSMSYINSYNDWVFSCNEGFAVIRTLYRIGEEANLYFTNGVLRDVHLRKTKKPKYSEKLPKGIPCPNDRYNQYILIDN